MSGAGLTMPVLVDRIDLSEILANVQSACSRQFLSKIRFDWKRNAREQNTCLCM